MPSEQNQARWVGARKVWPALGDRQAPFDSYREREYVANAPAGQNILTATAVTAGNIWIIEHMLAYNETSAITRLELALWYDGGYVYLRRDVTVAANTEIVWTGQLTLVEGEYVGAVFSGCNLNDNIALEIAGYKVAEDVL